MNDFKIEVIENMVGDLQIKLFEIDNQIQNHERCIKEANVYIDSLSSKEVDTDWMFSPRTREDSSKFEMQKKLVEIKTRQEQCKTLSVQRKQLAEQVYEMEKFLKHERNRMLEVSILDRERQMIAKRLHDLSLPPLFSTIEKIDSCSMDVVQAPLKVKEELGDVKGDLQSMMNRIHDVIFDIHPSTFGHVNFKNVMEQLPGKMKCAATCNITVNIEDIICENLYTLKSIYYSVEECIDNIDKHAKARNVSLTGVNVDNRYVITIKDDGDGFEYNSKNADHYPGLSLIADRMELLKGNMRVDSILNKGTTITLYFPI